jgi:DNA-binding transcriptional LysR family regulator
MGSIILNDGGSYMELNDLIIFKTVVDEGSISKAAKALGYVQPNVSERIKKLEDELATPLLHRNNTGISLLPSGEILLEYSKQIVHLVEEAKREITMSRETYRIGTSQSILSSFLKNRIEEDFMKYQLIIDQSSHLLPLLRHQKADMIITYTNHTDPALEEVYRTHLSMSLQKASGKSVHDYSNEYFFVSHDPHCPFRSHTVTFLEEHGLSMRKLHHVDSYSLIKEYVTQGKGLAFLPRPTVADDAIDELWTGNLPIYFYINRSSQKRIPSDMFEKI